MNITNHHNLPEAIVRAMQSDSYDAGKSDATVSSLHEPPRVVILRQKHKGELTYDVSERIASLLGTAFHKVMETSAVAGEIVEKRYYTGALGWTVSGQVDKYSGSHIVDWKVLSVWAVTVGDAIKEYTKKLNTYAWILRQNGLEVKKLSIVVLFRDWQAREARSNPDYPQAQVVEYDLEVWEPHHAEGYVLGLVERHQGAQVSFDGYGDLPTCTEEEKWSKPTRYAVMKGDNKRATKVCDTYSEALQASAGIPKSRVETRAGEDTRCMHFCPVRTVCEHGKSLQIAAEEAF